MLKVSTSSGRWDPFCTQIAGFLGQDITELTVDGLAVRGYRSPDNPALWIRDHSDIVRAGKYFENDVSSAVDAFAATQNANGRIFDYVTSSPLPWTGERENWERWVRIPVEADVEYRFVNAAFEAWQATGDDDWIDSRLDALQRALEYTTTHPWRWDDSLGLVKRAFTMDTWDFDYTAGRHPWLNFQITPHTLWGVAHGDNSGLHGAALRFATLCRYLGRLDEGDRWVGFCEGLRDRANRLLFNGRFYRHFHKITPFELHGVDEEEQLSLSNPMAINRGLATDDISVAILEEYRRRRASGSAFAEWYSIDPPFPFGFWGEEKLVQGAYINGGIFPLVGGEIARAAFEHGFESYGVETLDQYREMIAEKGETYLWYFPDGTASSAETSTSPEATPSDGWGASAMLHAFVEGLCGIVDRLRSFDDVRFAPRWVASGDARASVELGYAASGATFSYDYELRESADNGSTMSYTIRAAEARVEAEVLLPAGVHPARLTIDGKEREHAVTTRRDSRYCSFGCTVRGSARILIELVPDG